MKPVLSIAFSLLFFVQAIQPSMNFFCELQKLPALFEHYQELRESEGVSFLPFLSQHYAGRDGATDDHRDEHDSQLPFHGAHQCGHVYVFVPSGAANLHLEVPELLLKTDANISIAAIRSADIDTPFQPPKS